MCSTLKSGANHFYTKNKNKLNMGKKEVIWLLLTILCIPSVLAIDISDIPILLIIPIILILLVIIIFVVIYIRDKLTIKSLALPTFENIGKVETKKTQVKQKTTKPKTDYYNMILKLEKKLPYTDPKITNKELINLIRSFFSEYLNISYQFTFEELENEIKKKGKGITFAARNLSKIQYGPDKLSANINKKIISEFKTVVKKVQGYTTNLTIEQINEMIKKGIVTAKKNRHEGIKTYRNIYYHYNGLPKKDRPRLYKKVMVLYRLIS